jgi:hypothetical protein
LQAQSGSCFYLSKRTLLLTLYVVVYRSIGSQLSDFSTVQGAGSEVFFDASIFCKCIPIADLLLNLFTAKLVIR